MDEGCGRTELRGPFSFLGMGFVFAAEAVAVEEEFGGFSCPVFMDERIELRSW